METMDFAYLEKERQRQAALNGETNIDVVVSSTRKKRPKDATPLADITGDVEHIENVRVKVEKTSNAQPELASANSESSVTVDIKREDEDMPAPKKLPPRKKKINSETLDVPKRSTRTRTKPRKYDEFDSQPDQDEKSDTENHAPKAIPVQEPVRSTRSKMRQAKKPVDETTSSQVSESSEPEVKKIRSTRTNTIKKTKRNRSDSSEDKEEEEKKNKKSKSSTSSDTEVNKTSQTEYEDAISTIEPDERVSHNPNATYVAAVSDARPILDSTVIVEKPKVIGKANDVEPQKEEESNNKKEDVRTPPKPRSKKKHKEIFSPFEKTPMKKKVEAFEKLQNEASNIPIKAARSKKQSEGETRTSSKPKACTPFTSKFMPKTCSTSRITKIHPGKQLDTSVSSGDTTTKSLSALKASQAEFKEREKRRQEKEREALKKREALLQAQTEEKRRKREEKQLKAQQHREILEKEKQKLLEEHKRKEDKYKQAIAEKEERLQKQKEEADKKRMLAKKKAEKEKMREMEERTDETRDENELARQKQKQKMQQRAQLRDLPVYMTTKTPLLPTDDCYDSDDSDYGMPHKNLPYWVKGKEVYEKLIPSMAAGEKMKNTLFCRQTQTPDLQEIFVCIDPRKLKRTSSAIWRKPPRYTLFTATNDTRFSEDSEEDIDD
ncbi:hypothetical protein JTB14_008915 [Gonioctena quinquepunctata]|nr:hypothetical protein JTB14_008915 [Gonioctena quinquepunctata]